MTIVAGLACLAALSDARAEVQNCTAITSVPATITQPGVYCLKQDLVMSASGNAITINANSAILEMNGFSIDGTANTTTTGIYALDRQNITIRNGAIQGFDIAVNLQENGDASSNGHIVEDMRVEGARAIGLNVRGSHVIIRKNQISGVGSPGGTPVYGMFLDRGFGFSVTRNVISGVTTANSARGIALGGLAPGAVVGGNEVNDVSGGFEAYGIQIGSSRAVVKDNVVRGGSGTMTYGISGTFTDTSCIDNLVSGFAFAYGGCSYDDGNRSY